MHKPPPRPSSPLLYDMQICKLNQYTPGYFQKYSSYVKIWYYLSIITYDPLAVRGIYRYPVCACVLFLFLLFWCVRDISGRQPLW